MRRISPHDTADGNHGIGLVKLGHLLRGKSQLDSSRHTGHIDILLLYPVTEQGIDSSFQ